MADAGVSLAAILAAATINNARQFNIDEDYGTVEVGKVANLLLLEQNPLTTVDAWSNIHHIILHGEVFERSDLLQMLWLTNHFSGQAAECGVM